MYRHVLKYCLSILGSVQNETQRAPITAILWLYYPECKCIRYLCKIRRVLKEISSLFVLCYKVKVKVKVTLVQVLRLCTGRTAHRGSKGIALLFHDHGTRRGWGVSVTPRPLFTPGKDPIPIAQEAVWALGPVWRGVENLAPHRDSIPGPSSQQPVSIPTEPPGPPADV